MQLQAELLKSQLQGISEQTTERRCRDQNCGGDIQAQELTCRQAGGRNVVLRLRLAAPGITASTRTNRTRLLDLDAYFDRIQWRGPIPPSRASSRSFCAACGSTGPSSTGRRRWLLRSLHMEDHRIPATQREKTSLLGPVAVVRSLDAWRALERATALLTLIHQCHLTPSCGRPAPAAERTVAQQQ